jgi:hypothetical protein
MFYSVDNRTDKEVGSVFPQVSCLSQSYAHLLRSNEYPPANIKLVFELENRAKLTDILSQAAISADGLLINEKVKTVFENFNLMNHIFFPVSIKTKDGVLNYYWLHLNESFISAIDYKNSTFCWTEYELEQDSVDIISFEDYIVKKKKNGIYWGVNGETIKLLPNKFKDEIDLFNLGPFDFTIYISDRLKEALEKANISGIEIEETSGVLL